MIGGDVNSTSIDVAGTQFVMNDIEGTARYLGERVVKFLQNHSEDYPNYLNQGTDPDIYPRDSAYRRGIYLPKNRDRFITNDLLRRWLR